MLVAERDLLATVSINADRDRVWSLLIDPATMPSASPELFAVTRMRRGPLSAGETFVGWNRRKAVIWPTVNTIIAADPGRRLSWRTRTSGATWTYDLVADGDDKTVVNEHRQMSDGAPAFARVFADLLLGGLIRHTDELEAHLSQTLRWLKVRAER